MKKFALLLCIAVLLSFAGFAFAQDESGGHVVNPHARIYPEAAIDDYSPSSSDVVVSPDVVGLTVIAFNKSTPADFTAENIFLPKATINRVYVQTTMGINIEHPTSADYVYITLKNYPTTHAKSDLYAFIKAKSTASPYTSNDYYAFAATLASPDLVSSSDLTFRVSSPDVFFTSNDVIIAEAKTSSGGGDSGCNAGFAGLLLLAAVPLIYFRKKK